MGQTLAALLLCMSLQSVLGAAGESCCWWCPTTPKYQMLVNQLDCTASASKP